MPVTYDPTTPAIAQDDSWSCAPTSLRWALTALGRNPGPTYIEDLLVRDGIVSRDDGLLDASGGPLAAWISRPGDEYYGSEGFHASNEPSASFDDVAAESVAYPLLLGGRGWRHWSGARGYDPEHDLLLLANPSSGWMGVEQTMNRHQFSALGPFSMVRVQHPDLATPAPAPIPNPGPNPGLDPRDFEIAELKRQLDEERTKLGVLQAQYLPALHDIARAIGELKPA